MFRSLRTSATIYVLSKRRFSIDTLRVVSERVAPFIQRGLCFLALSRIERSVFVIDVSRAWLWKQGIASISETSSRRDA